MKNYRLFTFCFLLFVFAITGTDAYSQKLQSVSGSMPSFPYPISYMQPDGSYVNIYLKGDEFLNWAKTSDEYTLIKNKQNGYEYAIIDVSGNLVPSGVLANDPGKRNNNEETFLKSISKNLQFNRDQILKARSKRDKPTKNINAFPSTGTGKYLMILVNFNNTTTTYTQTNFSNYMNQTGYNFHGATGSFKDYYLDNSFNQLSITTIVTEWVTVNHPHDYYGPSSNWAQLAYDAVVAAHIADPSLDFSQFDNDGDGAVDGIAIMHQGPGQEATGNSNDVWSHSGDISSGNLNYNGVDIGRYTMEPEITGSYMSTVGVICHEFAHNLGLPDLYDVDYSSNGMGNWDIMAGGSWLNSGKTPSNHNCWSKYVLHWITPTTISSANNDTLYNASQNQDCYKITTPTSNEYFLLENRQHIGWDAYLPGHGMLILHIDGNLINSTLSNNTVNDNPSHQGVDIVEADNTLTTNNSGDGGDPFPGTSHKTVFTDGTTPDSHTWAGASINKPITNIAENNSTHVITFGFMGGAPGPLNADFYADNTTIFAGSTAVFTSFSVTPAGTTITDYQWTFTGGNPSSYSGQNPPAITYDNTGNYTVSLTITNSINSSDTETKTNYITVNPAPTCNWIIQASHFTTASTGVAFLSIVDPSTAWGVGLNGQTGAVLTQYTRTSDGTTWHAGTMSGVTSGDVPSCIAGVSSTVAYITAYNTTTPSYGGVFVTTNGGTSWTKQTTAAFSGSAAFPDIIHFFNSNEGLCMGDPNGGYFEIYTTTNGGTTWSRVPQANIPANQSGEYGYTNLYDAVGDTIWYGTNKGRVFKSADKGIHWSVYAVSGFSDMSHLTFNDANNGLAQQINYNTSTGAITSVVMRVTHDGGQTWSVLAPGSGIFYSDIDGVPGVAGKYISVGRDISGNYGSSFSDDYGTSWTNIDGGTQYISTKFYNTNTGWAGGFNTNYSTRGIYKYNSLLNIDEGITNNREEAVIYPNPVSDRLNIQLHGAQQQLVKIRIYNLLGELIHETDEYNVNENYYSSVDVSSYTKGVYLAIIETHKQIFKQKIIIE
ncbi:MAG: M6 family metalloprotease domain-containing protein [Bacteroidia bacterium]|nr:M6 family metalloprotease domain-containing protein [Bacteroidia bacterium]